MLTLLTLLTLDSDSSLLVLIVLNKGAFFMPKNEKNEAQKLIAFIEELGILKNIPRTGWRFRGIKNSESVADHSYRTAVLAMLLADMLAARGEKIDVEKILRISLLHEIAESRIGDIPFPALKYLKESAKDRIERQAVKDMLSDFGEIGKLYLKLWSEFERRNSFEAKIVRAADKLELLIQAFEYEKIGYKSLDNFWKNRWNRRDFDVHIFIKEILESLLKSRDALMNFKSRIR